MTREVEDLILGLRAIWVIQKAGGKGKGELPDSEELLLDSGCPVRVLYSWGPRLAIRTVRTPGGIFAGPELAISALKSNTLITLAEASLAHASLYAKWDCCTDDEKADRF